MSNIWVKIFLSLLNLLFICILSFSCNFYSKKTFLVKGKYLGSDTINDGTRIFCNGLKIGQVVNDDSLLTIQIERNIGLCKTDTFLYHHDLLGEPYVDVRKKNGGCSGKFIGSILDTINVITESDFKLLDPKKKERILRELNNSMKTIDSILNEK